MRGHTRDAQHKKGAKVAGNLIHVSAIGGQISYTLSIELIVD